MKAIIKQILPDDKHGNYQIILDVENHRIQTSIEPGGLLHKATLYETIREACRKYKDDLKRNQVINILIGKEVEVDLGE